MGYLDGLQQDKKLLRFPGTGQPNQQPGLTDPTQPASIPGITQIATSQPGLPAGDTNYMPTPLPPPNQAPPPPGSPFTPEAPTQPLIPDDNFGRVITPPGSPLLPQDRAPPPDEGTSVYDPDKYLDPERIRPPGELPPGGSFDPLPGPEQPPEDLPEGIEQVPLPDGSEFPPAGTTPPGEDIETDRTEVPVVPGDDEVSPQDPMQDWNQMYLDQVFGQGRDFDPIRQEMTDQRDAGLRQLAEMMASRGMSASGAHSGMAGDIYRNTSRDMAAAYQDFEQQSIQNGAQAAQMMMGDKWNKLQMDDQKVMAQLMFELDMKQKFGKDWNTNMGSREYDLLLNLMNNPDVELTPDMQFMLDDAMAKIFPDLSSGGIGFGPGAEWWKDNKEFGATEESVQGINAFVHTWTPEVWDAVKEKYSSQAIMLFTNPDLEWLGKMVAQTEKYGNVQDLDDPTGHFSRLLGSLGYSDAEIQQIRDSGFTPELLEKAATGEYRDLQEHTYT